MLPQFFISAVAIAGRPRTQFAKKNDFSRFSAFLDSAVYACCGSYLFLITPISMVVCDKDSSMLNTSFHLTIQINYSQVQL